MTRKVEGPLLCCIQCALKAMVEGEPPPTWDETPSAHMARCHPDPEVTAREREDLERRLYAKAAQAGRN